MIWAHGLIVLGVLGGSLILVRANLKLQAATQRMSSYVRMFNAMMSVDNGCYPPRISLADGSRNIAGLKVGDMVRMLPAPGMMKLYAYGLPAEDYGVGVIVSVQDLGLRVEFFRKPTPDGEGLYFNFAECGSILEKIESPPE